MDENLIFPDPRPSRADAVKNRQLLMQTAQRLFADKGVDAVTMENLADAAGVGKGTLYRHFPKGKVELCQVLIDQDQRDLQDRTLKRLREHGDPLLDLEWFLREVIAFVVRNQTLMFAEALMGGLLDHPAHLWWRQTIRGLLARIKLDVDLDYTTDLIFVMLDPRTIQYQMNARSYAPERIADGLITILNRILP
jgi:AcrR family transcriptional regulator